MSKKIISIVLALTMVMTMGMGALAANPGDTQPRSDIQVYEEYEIIRRNYKQETENITDLGAVTATRDNETFTISTTMTYGDKFTGAFALSSGFKNFLGAQLSVDFGTQKFFTVSRTSSPAIKGQRIGRFTAELYGYSDAICRTYQLNMISGVSTLIKADNVVIKKALASDPYFTYG